MSDIEKLIKDLESEDRAIVFKAIRFLGEIKTAESADVLISFLGKVENFDNPFYERALEALIKSGSTAIPALMKIFKDDSSETRRGMISYFASCALAGIKDEALFHELVRILLQPRAKLIGRETDIRSGAAFVLGLKKDPRAVKPLIRVLKRAHRLRISIKHSLVEIGEPAVLPLLEVINHKDADVRFQVCEALWNIPDIRATASLIERLKDTDKIVRRIAEHALGAIKDSRATQPLIRALKDREMEIRCGAAEALGKIGSFDAVSALISRLKDRNKYVVERAVLALAQIGAPRSALLTCLETKPLKTRKRFFKILREHYDQPDYTFPQLLTVDIEEVRKDTIKVLEEIIRKTGSLEQLRRIKISLMELTSRECRELPTFHIFRPVVIDLLMKINKRINEILSKQIDIGLDKKYLKPRRPTRDPTNKVRRLLAA